MRDLPHPIPNEDNDYREARDALLKAEIELRAKTEEVAALRRALPLGGAIETDYLFTAPDGSGQPLSGLFGSNNIHCSSTASCMVQTWMLHVPCAAAFSIPLTGLFCISVSMHLFAL